MNEPPTNRPAWPISLLWRDGLLERFAGHYARLRRRPRRWRAQLARRASLTLAGAALLLALAGPGALAGRGAPTGPQAVITVADGAVLAAADGQCALIEAIDNANDKDDGARHADCAAGNPGGADTIALPANGLFTLAVPRDEGNVGPLGLPWISSAITIHGNGATIRRAPAAPNFRVLAVGQKGNLTLDNATISGGRLNDDGLDYYADYGGAGIFNEGTLTLSGVTVADNTVSSYHAIGGGIENRGDLTITGSAIITNAAEGSRSGWGGGVINRATGDLLIVDSLISGNVAYAAKQYGYAFGGGIYNEGALTLLDSTVGDNEATSDYFAGGGGVESSGVATISGSLFVGNRAVNGYGYDYFADGGALGNSNEMTIVNSSISGNEAGRYGGGLFNYYDLTIANSTITDNLGGGVVTTCENVFVSVRTALQRSLISGNAGGEVAIRYAAYCPAGVQVDAYNIFGHSGQAGLEGFAAGPSDIVPAAGLLSLLAPLADNGGPTLTHDLPAGSPARDRAPSADCLGGLVGGVDQRGYPRNFNGAGSATAADCDVGALEFQPTPATPTPTATASPTPTATATPTITPTGTVAATATPSPTATQPAPAWRLLLPLVTAAD